MWLPKGKRTRPYVDREKVSRSFFGALGLTTRKMRIYPTQGNQNAEQITLMMDRLQREIDEGKKIAVVLDDTRFHYAKALIDLYAPVRLWSGSNPFTCPYGPDLGPHRARVERCQKQYRQPPRSPRRTPSRHSLSISSTAPSTTTSSISQSHHHTPILFDSSHICCLCYIVSRGFRFRVKATQESSRFLRESRRIQNMDSRRLPSLRRELRRHRAQERGTCHFCEESGRSRRWFRL